MRLLGDDESSSKTAGMRLLGDDESSSKHMAVH